MNCVGWRLSFGTRESSRLSIFGVVRGTRLSREVGTTVDPCSSVPCSVDVLAFVLHLEKIYGSNHCSCNTRDPDIELHFGFPVTLRKHWDWNQVWKTGSFYAVSMAYKWKLPFYKFGDAGPVQVRQSPESCCLNKGSKAADYLVNPVDNTKKIARPASRPQVIPEDQYRLHLLDTATVSSPC